MRHRELAADSARTADHPPGIGGGAAAGDGHRRRRAGLSLLYGAWPLRLVVRFYVDTMRGIPQLVLIFAIFYGFPRARPAGLGDRCRDTRAQPVLRRACVGESMRGGVGSIPRGQMDAAKGIGLNFAQRLRHVIFPQAMGRILPAWVNTAVEMVKASSLVSLVSVVRPDHGHPADRRAHARSPAVLCRRRGRFTLRSTSRISGHGRASGKALSPMPEV